jgi:hypothetical protein
LIYIALPGILTFQGKGARMSDKRQQPSPLTIYIGKDEEERERIDAGLRKLAKRLGCRSTSDLVKKIARGELAVVRPTPKTEATTPAPPEADPIWLAHRQIYPLKHK